VCVTAIGLIGIMRSLNRIESVVDDLLAIGGLLFMVIAALSFLGIRTGIRKKWRGFALTLDVLFCVGLLLLVSASLLLTWMVI
jgi:hypothetical protein